MSASTQGAQADANILESCGLPIFFKITEVDGSMLPTPESRYGQSVRLWARSLSVMQ